MPDIPKPETLEKRYLGKLSKKALMLMKALLKLDPNERITGEQALEFPYFDNLRETIPRGLVESSYKKPPKKDKTSKINNFIK